MSVVSSRWIRNEWAFFSLSRSCFDKSSEIWRYLHLVVLSDSGICLTLSTAFFLPTRISAVICNLKTGKNCWFQLGIRTLFCIRIWSNFLEASTKSLFPSFTILFSKDESCLQWLLVFQGVSKNTIDLFWWEWCCGFKFFEMLSQTKLLSPKTVVKNRQCAEGYGVSILSFCDKTHTWCSHLSIWASLKCKPFFFWIAFLKQFIDDSRRYARKSGLCYTQHAICCHPYSPWHLYFDSYYALFHNYLSLLRCS